MDKPEFFEALPPATLGLSEQGVAYHTLGASCLSQPVVGRVGYFHGIVVLPFFKSVRAIEGAKLPSLLSYCTLHFGMAKGSRMRG